MKTTNDIQARATRPTNILTPDPTKDLRPTPAQTAFFALFAAGIITLVVTTIMNAI